MFCLFFFNYPVIFYFIYLFCLCIIIIILVGHIPIFISDGYFSFLRVQVYSASHHIIISQHQLLCFTSLQLSRLQLYEFIQSNKGYTCSVMILFFIEQILPAAAKQNSRRKMIPLFERSLYWSNNPAIKVETRMA